MESKNQSIVTLKTELTEQEMLFIIEDNGPGMTKEILDHIGEPFITNKPPGNGMGLGLFISKLTANTYGGDLHITKSNTEGTSVTLSIKR